MFGFLARNKIVFAIILGAVIIGIFVYFGLKIQIASSPLAPLGAPRNDGPTKQSIARSEGAIVTKVIDGDTVVVEGGNHVRLLGMDADEKGYPCYDSAKNRLEELVLGKQVLLEKDKTDSDQYGRLLRYIFVGSMNVDLQLVKEGLAVARFYSDVKYKIEIISAEKQAEENKIGCKWK